jgi:hypothetical protein
VVISAAAAIAQMRLHHPVDQGDAVEVEVGVGLVEQPQRRRRQPQPGQPEPLLLAGGERAQGRVLVAAQADDGHRRFRCLRLAPAMQAAQEVQVLQRRGRLQARQVAEIGDEARAQFMPRRLAVDPHMAGIGPQQAREHAQQGGLAGAVAALDQQASLESTAKSSGPNTGVSLRENASPRTASRGLAETLESGMGDRF